MELETNFFLTPEEVHRIKDSLCEYKEFKVFDLYEFSQAIVKANDERRKENFSRMGKT